VRPAALVGGLLWVRALIRRGESDPAVRLDYEQAADIHLKVPLPEGPNVKRSDRLVVSQFDCGG
jgi:hypothetical protein